MKFKIKYNPDFFTDIAQAVDWYNEKQSGLGDRFFGNVKKQAAKLSSTALHFAIKYDDVRCMGIKNFPTLSGISSFNGFGFARFAKTGTH